MDWHKAVFLDRVGTGPFRLWRALGVAGDFGEAWAGEPRAWNLEPERSGTGHVYGVLPVAGAKSRLASTETPSQASFR